MVSMPCIERRRQRRGVTRAVARPRQLSKPLQGRPRAHEKGVYHLYGAGRRGGDLSGAAAWASLTLRAVRAIVIHLEAA